jgi:hypothetical protein
MKALIEGCDVEVEHLLELSGSPRNISSILNERAKTLAKMERKSGQLSSKKRSKRVRGEFEEALLVS